MVLEELVRGFTDAQKGEYLLFLYEQAEQKIDFNENDLLSKEELRLISKTYDPIYLVEDDKSKFHTTGAIIHAFDFSYKTGTLTGRLTSPFNYLTAAKHFADGVSLGVNYASCHVRILDEAQKRKSYSHQYWSLAEELLNKKELNKYQECLSFGFGMRLTEALGFNLGVTIARPHRLSDLKWDNQKDFFRSHPLFDPFSNNGEYATFEDEIHPNGVIERDIVYPKVILPIIKLSDWIEDQNGMMIIPHNLPDTKPTIKDYLAIKEYIAGDTIYHNTNLQRKKPKKSKIPFGDAKTVYGPGDNCFVKFPNGKVIQPNKEEFDKMIEKLF